MSPRGFVVAGRKKGKKNVKKRTPLAVSVQDEGRGITPPRDTGSGGRSII